MALRSLKVEDNNFAEGTAGHRLTDAVKNPTAYWESYSFTCTCGAVFEGKPRADGTLSKGTRELWRRHVEAESADPNEAYEVGQIKKPRITWDVKVINASHPQADSYSANNRWMKDWPSDTGWHMHYRWGVVADKTTKGGKTSRTLITICRSKQEAVRNAIRFIEKHDEFETSLAESLPQGVPVASFRTTMMELLDRTDTAADGDILELDLTVKELDEVLSLVPVITARRDELARKYEDRTVGLLKQ